METKELRIGNLHETDCFSHPRMGISPIKINNKCFSAITSYGIHLVDEGKLHFKPIPLTEEWLVKFGFKEVKAKTGIQKAFIKRAIRIELSNGGNFYFKGFPKNKVHQLQNLYFALTGEELELI